MKKVSKPNVDNEEIDFLAAVKALREIELVRDELVRRVIEDSDISVNQVLIMDGKLKKLFLVLTNHLPTIFPSTITFSKKATNKSSIKIAIENLNEFINQAWKSVIFICGG